MVSVNSKFNSSAMRGNENGVCHRVRCSKHTLFGYMEKVIARYRNQGQLRTSETYSSTLNSFRTFRKGRDLPLKEVDSELMEAYGHHLKHIGLCPNTISFYLKHLRAVYNRAVDEGLVVDKHPFRRVTTSIAKTPKRALSLQLVRQLKAMDLSHDPSRCFARDMFLFSFYTRGMSFVDIAYLQKKNLKNGILSYCRRKTHQRLSMHWEGCMQEIVDKYCADKDSPYLFSILPPLGDDSRKRYLSVMCRINRHLKQLGEELGMHQPLTLYCARHSWASIAHEKGIPLSVISEGMGHDSEKTTQIYLASLQTEVIDKANRKILKLLC